jgi:hypothetical protein
MSPFRNRCFASSRFLNPLVAAAFLFFLFYTAPHRVHHFFERGQPHTAAHKQDRHDHSDSPNPSGRDADCVFQASSNRCADGLAEAAQPFTAIWRQPSRLAAPEHDQPHQLFIAPSHSRAPPAA